MTVWSKRRPENSGQEDRVLWREVQDKDCKKAFAVLFERYWSTMYSTAFRYLGDRQKSEDITHDVLLQIWEKRRSLQIEHFRAYLKAATRYHVYKALKAKSSIVETLSDDLTHLCLTPTGNAGDEKIRGEEAHETILQMIAPLPARCREIFILSRIEQLDNDQIATQLGVTKRSVENQLTIALRHIRQQYATLISLALIVVLDLL